jgi:hypothetical protein
MNAVKMMDPVLGCIGPYTSRLLKNEVFLLSASSL